MQYFVYGRDRPGAYPLKVRLSNEHWDFMDRYADRLIARGPTLTGHDDEAESTGSLHIVDLPDARAARDFAYEEPYFRAGAFESVLLCRFDNVLGRTMWDFTGATKGYARYLLIAMDASEPAPITSPQLIVYGGLSTLDGETRLGRAAAVEAPNPQAAGALLPAQSGVHTEVRPWRFGGRPVGTA
ncbi:YciI family protein [Actinopolymorpha singaporensis]|uniref:YCII-related domain-containing protein n=1 Tax=Actinopolymorpha singaporensis TaxID=117157 RepID=A0A1H1N0T2_9ACTN|nr:YciI family protein [Actinopolymorpha singaporensis]SDR92527.1 hypothetical protein SAMN04489717_1049 [Actinopolymorpha singaporensis]